MKFSLAFSLLVFLFNTEIQAQNKIGVKVEITPESQIPGEIKLDISGGRKPYRALWADGDNTLLKKGRAGLYSVVIRDSSGDSLSQTYTIGAQIQWEILNGMKMQGNSLATSQPAANNSSFVSKNIYNPGETGLTQFTVTDATSKLITGLSTPGIAAESPSGFLYGFLLDNGRLNTVNAGVVSPAGNYSSSDIFAIDVQSGAIRYLQNNNVLKTINFNNSQALAFSGLVVSATTTVVITPYFPYYWYPQITLNSLTDAACGNDKSGQIDVSVSGGFAPYTYSWSNLAHTQDLSNVPAGTYTLTVRDQFGQTASATYTIATAISWGEFDGNLSVNPSNESITKSSGTNGWNAGAASNNTLPASTNGWAEFKVSNIAVNYVFGLSDVGSAVTNYQALNYGIKLTNTSSGYYTISFYPYFHIVWNTTNTYTVNISQNGVNTPYSGTYIAGDVFRVERQGNRINYYKNGTLIYFTTATNISAKIMKAEVFVNYTGSQLVNCRCNFGCPVIIQYAELRKKTDGGYVPSINNTLYFQYNEEYVTNNNFTYKIFDNSNTAVLSSSTLSKTYGDNRYALNVAGLTAGKFYILEVTSSKKEKWYLRFKN